MAFDAGSIEASLDLNRNPFNEGMKRARKDARDFEKQDFRATVSLEAQTGAARRDIDAFRAEQRRREINIPVDADINPVNRKLEEIEKNTATTAARSGNNMARLLLNPIVLQLGLLPGIAAVAGAGTAAALTLAVGGFAAIAVLANKNNDDIKAAYSDLWKNVVADTKKLTAPLVPYIVGIAGQLSGAWIDVQPAMEAAFAGLGPQMAEVTDGVIRLGKNALPGIVIGANNSTAAIAGFSDMLALLGTGVGQFFTEISYKSAEAGRGAATFGEILRGVLQFLGVEVGQFAGAWDQIGAKFSSVFNQLLGVITQFTGGGLGSFATILNVTLTVLQAVLAVVGPLAGGLGTMAGTVLGLVAGWKILAGVVGLASRAFGLVAPAAIAGRLAALGGVARGTADRFGDLTTRVTGSGRAGDAAERGFNKVSNAVGRAASALPLLGAGIILVQSAFDNFFPSADKLATEMAKGGQAAQEAQKKISNHSIALSLGDVAQKTFGASSEEVTNAMIKQRSGMTELERRQQDLTRSTNDWNAAVDKYGENSPQAATASQIMANATDRLKEAQDAAATATKSHTDRIVEQQNLMLGAVGARLNYQSSLLSLESSQKALNDAVKAHGPASLEARQADVQYQQNLVGVITAIGQRATAEGEAKKVTDVAAYSSSAMAAEVLRLAEAAGVNAPPALRQMVLGLDDGALAAQGAHREIDGAGNAIIVLPDGKRLKFPNDAKAAELNVRDLKSTIESTPTSWTTSFFARYVGFLNGNTPSSPPGGGTLPLGDSGARREPGKADGGLIHGKGGPRSDSNMYFVSDTEYIVNSAATRRNLGILEFINNGGDVRAAGFGVAQQRADGGLIQAEDGTMVPSSFYDKPPADYVQPQWVQDLITETRVNAQNRIMATRQLPGARTNASLTTAQSSGQYKVLADLLARATGAAVQAALDGARMTVDGQGIAKLVRDENRNFEQR